MTVIDIEAVVKMTTDAFNPISAELKSERSKLAALNTRARKIRAEIKEHERFDEPKWLAAREKAEGDCLATAARREDLRQSLAKSTTRIEELSREIDETWFFSSAGRAARRNLDQAREQLEAQQQEQGINSATLEESKNCLRVIVATLNRHAAFDRAKSSHALARLEAKISERSAKVADVKKRKEALDALLAEPVERMEVLRREERSLRLRLEDLSREKALANKSAEYAASLDRELSSAASSFERRQIHEKCERFFGEGRPGKVQSSARRAVRDFERDGISTRKRLAQIARDSEKLQRRIDGIVQRGSRNIRALVIDGNNLCYDGHHCIGIAALKPLTAELVKRFEVTVIFDADIRHMLRRTDSQIRSQLPGATVHIVADGQKADMTLLSVAADRDTFVLSNDRFADFPDQPAVRGHRLINHAIVQRHVIVEDFGIDITYRKRPSPVVVPVP